MFRLMISYFGMKGQRRQQSSMLQGDHKQILGGQEMDKIIVLGQSGVIGDKENLYFSIGDQFPSDDQGWAIVFIQKIVFQVDFYKKQIKTNKITVHTQITLKVYQLLAG